MRIEWDRLLFRVSCYGVAATALVLFGMYAGANTTQAYRLVVKVRNDVSMLWSERHVISGAEPGPWLTHDAGTDSGVIVNTLTDEDDLVMLQGMFGDDMEIRLIRRSGELVARWPISYSQLAADVDHIRNKPTNDWNVETHGAVMTSDGSVVFNLDHIALVKLDQCGRRLWRVDQPTHHAVTEADDGGFWAPFAQNFYEGEVSPSALFKAPVSIDGALLASADGRVLRTLSALDVFIKNDRIGLLTITGTMNPSPMVGTRPDIKREVFHLNDVEALPAALASDFPQFSPGDLLLSFRNRNLVMVIDPATLAIKWERIGPWVRQHDADWVRGGKIVVFDNNRDGSSDGSVLGGSRIIAVDPRTQDYDVLYGAGAAQHFYAIRRGKQQVLDTGHLFITNAERGHVFEVDEPAQWCGTTSTAMTRPASRASQRRACTRATTSRRIFPVLRIDVDLRSFQLLAKRILSTRQLARRHCASAPCGRAGRSFGDQAKMSKWAQGAAPAKRRKNSAA